MLFSNTKKDMGDCGGVHDEKMKAQYALASSRHFVPSLLSS